MAIDDDMDDRNDELKMILAAHEEFERMQQNSIAQQIANHLGPHASSADQSYVSRLAEERGRSRTRLKTKTPVEQTVYNTNGGPPSPPPGTAPVLQIAAGGAAKKGVKERLLKTIYTKRINAGRREDDVFAE